MSDYIEHVRSLVQNYLTQRKVVGNELIGKDVLLLPPFNLSVIMEGGAFRVDIEGSHGKFSTICQWVSISPFRDDISFVMPVKGAKPTIRKLTPLQPARRRMLDIVKPGTSMDATTFYRATASDGNTQVNARRRWGELRTEYGFETVYTGTRFARGSELPTNEPSPRPNMGRLNNAFFTEIYQDHLGKCNKCKRKVEHKGTSSNEPCLLDHRRPVPVGGDDSRQNLQLFCVTCNNLKNTACQNCQLSYECEKCSWAHPEKFHDAIVLRLNANEAKRLSDLAAKVEKTPEAYAAKLFQDALKRN